MPGGMSPPAFLALKQCRAYTDMPNRAVAQDVAAGRKNAANQVEYRCFKCSTPAWEPVR
jgi:hypothetical protein